MRFWVPWVMFANSQIRLWQSYLLKIELQSTRHSVNAQSDSAINSSQENKHTLLLFDSLICFIAWKWNFFKTTLGNDCLFSGQQTESRPVNLSPLPQKHALMQCFHCSAKRFQRRPERRFTVAAFPAKVPQTAQPQMSRIDFCLLIQIVSIPWMYQNMSV